jgi:hypothetical protein
MGFAGTFIADGLAVERGASTDALDATYLQAAIEARRSEIEMVPGSGDILGCCSFAGEEYVWRNHPGGLSACMYRAKSVGGWELVDLGHKITFGSGSSLPDSFSSGFGPGFSFADMLVVGDVLVGQTSGATCTVDYYRYLSGSLDDGDLAADVFYTAHQGLFVVGEQIKAQRLITNGIGIITTANTDITFPAGGRYEFEIYNFGGHASTEKLFGINGVGRGFEFNGERVQFIYTGMDTDIPEHVIAFKSHLFYSFQGGSVQHSSLTIPEEWDPITGAAELAIGDEVTGFEKEPGGVLAIFARNKTNLLSGTSVADWVLTEHTEESGAIERSIQRLSYPIYLDDRGITSLDAVQEFGDFTNNVLSDYVQPYLNTRTDQVQASMVVREKNQYRLFFSDNTALYFTFNNHALVGTTVVKLGKKVTATWSGEDENGQEVLYFGSTDGYLYRHDSGTSLDGEELVSYMRLPYYHYKTPINNKRFYSISLELDLQDQLSTNLKLIPDFSYADGSVPKSVGQTLETGTGGGIWGEVNWRDFTWGGGLVGEAFAHIDGHGRNMGIFINSKSTYEKPHTVHGVTVDFAVRNRRR